MAIFKVISISDQGIRDHAFGKPCLCPRDTRHFCHFRRAHGLWAGKANFAQNFRKFSAEFPQTFHKKKLFSNAPTPISGLLTWGFQVFSERTLRGQRRNGPSKETLLDNNFSARRLLRPFHVLPFFFFRKGKETTKKKTRIFLPTEP